MHPAAHEEFATWNGFVRGPVARIERPADEAAVVDAIARARAEGLPVKVVGGTHSFTDILGTDGVLLDLERLTGLVAVDGGIVRARGGTRLADLVIALEARGLALPNIGAWMEQTLAGALATGTHGSSGRHRDTLLAALRGVRLVDGRGQVVALAGDELRALTLGMLGVITEVTIACPPLFHCVRVKEIVDVDEAIANIDDALAAHDFVDLRWVGRIRKGTLTKWDKTDAAPTGSDRRSACLEGYLLAGLHRFLRAYPYDRAPKRLSRGLLHVLGYANTLLAFHRPQNQVWYRALTYNSRGVMAPHDEYELAVPRARAAGAVQEMRRILRADHRGAGLEFQIRFDPPSPVALSPTQERESAWIDINVFDRAQARPVAERLATLVYEEYEGRPHWGKHIPEVAGDLRPLYGEAAARFDELRARLDPDGVFVNAWSRRHLPPLEA